MQKIKVVEVITDTNIGGAGVLLCTRLKYSDRTRIESEVILPRGSELIARLHAIGIRTHEINACRDCSFELSAISQYIALFRQIRPDLINCHGALSARLAAKICGVRVRLYTRHCVYPLPEWQKRGIGKFFLGKVQGMLSSHMIAVAYSAKENLTEMGVLASKVSVIINGVQSLRAVSDEEMQALRASLGISGEDTVIGICARLEACKGHSCFLEAAERLLRRDPNYRFLIVGDGSLRKKLEDVCRENRIAPYVIFTGFCEDVSPYFHLMKININCSVGTETSSLALSEGMSIGLPAVVSDYGGNTYMVREGENGFVVPQNDPAKLAEAIFRICSDEALYDRLSRGAKERFLRELNAEAMTKKTEKLYCELFRKEFFKNQSSSTEDATAK
ncbi:MAG: glycosyltransferase [Clostridia bacterium]|nr:glycosyltransferase [Clostridia bacterium]